MSPQKIDTTQSKAAVNQAPDQSTPTISTHSASINTSSQTPNTTPLRTNWIAKRKGQANVSQMHYARQGVVTEEMDYVARRENLPVELIKDEVARGRMIIPANINHPNLEPMAIGIASKCKVNANIGASPNSSDINEEVAKMQLAVKYGADTLMDLSTGGGNLDEIRTAIINSAPIPIGTVPIYQALESVHGSIENLDAQDFLHIIEKHAQQGVDYMTIHAGILIEHLPLVKNRLRGTASRAAALWRSGCCTTTSKILSSRTTTTSSKSSSATMFRSAWAIRCVLAVSTMLQTKPSLQSSKPWATSRVGLGSTMCR